MKPATILIAESHESLRKALINWFEVVFPQCHLIEVNNSEQVVNYIRSEAPDVIVMDITQPGMSCLEATRQIRSILPHAPILIFGIYDDEIYRAETNAAGANAYVPKSAIYSELMPQITALLGAVPA